LFLFGLFFKRSNFFFLFFYNWFDDSFSAASAFAALLHFQDFCHVLLEGRRSGLESSLFVASDSPSQAILSLFPQQFFLHLVVVFQPPQSFDAALV